MTGNPSKQRGTLNIYKYDLNENEFAINYGFDSCNYPSLNLNTKAFRKFVNQCVGHPNMTIFNCKRKRDERYGVGRRILLEAGYELLEKTSK